MVLPISTILWLATIYHITHKYKGFAFQKNTKFFVFLSLIAIFNGTIFGVFRRAIYQTDYAGYTNIVSISIEIILFGIALIAELFIILLLYYEKNHYSFVVDHTKEYLELEKAHFAELQKRDQETRKFRHDLQNHLTVLSRYVQDGNIEKSCSYLQSINVSFSSLKPKYRTGNAVVDTILEQKRPLIEENRIELKIIGSLHTFQKIDDFDLCTIFSNALQNAIEACLKLENGVNRYIHINFFEMDDKYLMKFSNPVRKNIKTRNLAYTTSKRDKQNHGFGLMQIQQLAENHNGNMYLTCKQNVFTILVELEKTKE